jgi:hypothetical protein
MAGPPPRPRLRPGVAVTPLVAGLHLRGRGAGVTLEGSRALPLLWKLLSARLAADRVAGTAESADPRVEAALTTLTARLREHDLLVEHPDGAELPPWPGSSAADPARAAEAIRAARPVIATLHPHSPLATGLAQALNDAGASPRLTVDGRLAVGQAVVTADTPSGAVALAVSCDADGGFVTEPGPPGHARSEADAVAARLRPGTQPWTPPGSPLSAPHQASTPSGTHVALLAGAAAGRLLAAVAGLPDPAAHEDASATAATGHPAVLVARAEPPEATYHPWAGAPRTARQSPRAPRDLAEALHRITALTDPRLGVLDAPLPGNLPQLPASLVSCRTGEGPLVAGAGRADQARLEAACHAAELALADASGIPVVGATPGHAHGRALRRALLHGAAPTASGGIADDVWNSHPQARHWWTVLTVRMGRQAELSVRRLGSEQAHTAVVRIRPTPAAAAAGGRTATVPGMVSRAVEATAADAVTLAALGAVTRVMAAAHVPEGARHAVLTGAAAPLAAAGAELPGWADEGWTDVWLAGIAARETALHTTLRRLTGLRPTPWRRSGRPALATALRASGFTILNAPEGRR